VPVFIIHFTEVYRVAAADEEAAYALFEQRIEQGDEPDEWLPPKTVATEE
jgi:hypothetical protein